MKKLSLIICLALLLSFLPVSASNTEYTWFCSRRSDHTQPIADHTIDFIDCYNAIYVDKAHGDSCADKVVYLTFDAGYENGNIARILNILKEQEVTAAFFVLGHLIEQDTDLVVRMFEEGHLVCNHTFSHSTMINKTKDQFQSELRKLEITCKNKTGRDLSAFFRPPEGRFDEFALLCAQEMGYTTVFWSFAYDDWDNNRQMSPEKAKKKILDNIHNGEIMLLHPTSQTNAEILEDVIKELKSQGYRFGSLDEISIKAHNS